MGVSGSGKTTVGEALSARFGWPLLEGDQFPPKANIDKMSSGTPLTDDDRWPWLDAIATAMREAPDGVIVTCSSLRRIYRDRLRDKAGRPVIFVYLNGSRETLAFRLAARKGHFMPASLLDSQLATLEPPGADEPLVVPVSLEPPVEDVVMAAIDGVAAVR
ncbi:MAG: gluconokinase [Rhizobiales bacterium]|nr:gluconokinase [Hyphomicrobiales bacterium]